MSKNIHTYIHTYMHTYEYMQTLHTNKYIHTRTAYTLQLSVIEGVQYRTGQYKNYMSV